MVLKRKINIGMVNRIDNDLVAICVYKETKIKFWKKLET
jgi:hypothetical protein